jgi:membrane-associated HD superfamily phosphohydrolase
MMDEYEMFNSILDKLDRKGNKMSNTDMFKNLKDEADKIMSVDDMQEDSDDHEVINETKEEAFKRIANSRAKKAIKMIRLLKNLVGPNYEYTPEQCRLLADTLAKEVDEMYTVLANKVRDTPEIDDLF